MPVGNETNHVIQGLTVDGGLAINGGTTPTYLAGTSSGGLNVNGRSVSRYADLAGSRGLIAENYPAASCVSATVLTSGTIVFTGFYFYKGEVINSIVVPVNTAMASSAGVHKVGIYQPTSTTTATLLMASADQVAVWTTAGLYVTALTSQLVIPADGMYWIGIISVAGTPAAIVRANAALFTGRILNSTPPLAGALAGQTDLVASPTTISQTAGACTCFWYGVQ
jgi:ribosomal protein S16